MKKSFVNVGFVLLLSTTLSLLSIRAQAPPGPSPDSLKHLQDLADQVKAALQQGDLESANRLSSDLMLGIFKQRKALEPTPQEKLAKLEQDTPASGKARFYALPRLASTAFDAGELNKAEAYARELAAVWSSTDEGVFAADSVMAFGV